MTPAALVRSLLLALPAMLVAGACVLLDAPAGATALVVGLAAFAPTLNSLTRTERRRTAAAERSREFAQVLIDAIPDPTYVKQQGGRYVMVNEAFARYHGMSKADVLAGQLVGRAEDTANRALSLEEDERILAGAELRKEEHTQRHHTGEEVFRIISKRRGVYLDGKPVVVGIDHHITEWRVAERGHKQALEREVQLRLRTEQFVQDLIDLLPDAIYIKDAQSRLVMVNATAVRLRGMSREELIGLNAMDLAPRAGVGETSLLEDQQVLRGEEIVKEEQSVLPVTGEECFRVVFKRRCFDVDGQPVVVSIQHYITEWRQAERELNRLAQEDALTGIANRRCFSAEAQRAMDTAERHGGALTLLLVDVDHFKRVNDQHGHNVGDEVLVELARRLRAVLRKSDLGGRWGGEEFIALLHGGPQAALEFAERLRGIVADTPFPTATGPLRVTLSGGCAEYRPGDSLSSLVGRADEALYLAKSEGRNRVRAERPAMPG
ncbi:sensor domain-containing diguanylate cyclase [Roseateles asaccharophilus]|uniref:diguanylate cyclase n=1 Tax=Roseateles asaccharophilus TaxID=582607 RepID=A0ABU2A8H9_9BURK|nr:sensor domain-containing diguanylate cyclase [Roseateles asaccharophilus]MDR7333481.1 diguanylate cyclase (GGDEF)-like protein/PAS domain S-box-containing protein [Roseateles asaccharophilus]